MGAQDVLRFRCERCESPLGSFTLEEHHDGPLVLAEAPAPMRGGPNVQGRHGVKGHRKGRRLFYDPGKEGPRYRWECRCGRTILLSHARAQQLPTSRTHLI